MYRVAIVEDEIWILRGIQKTFQWKEYGFEVSYASTNAKEALEYICRYKPDVVFTDIKMPGISGIELAERIKEKGVKSKVIFVSGYADFEYAKKGIRLNVFEYCLKPIKQQEADELLEKLKNVLDAEKDAKTVYKEETDGKTSIENIRFHRMITYINENYEKTLTLRELTEKFELSTSYCCSLFKKYFDCRFSSYLNKLRVEEAAKLLVTETLSIEQVAQKVGYNDYYYFNKVFKRFCGCTPYQYRGRYKEEENGKI